MRKFFDLLESQQSGVHEISIAIRGFGRFAAPVQVPTPLLAVATHRAVVAIYGSLGVKEDDEHSIPVQ